MHLLGQLPPAAASNATPPPSTSPTHAHDYTHAGALALGYANIFVTAPSPENLRTLFDFVFRGLDAAGYQEHIDYDLVESTNPEWGRAVVRINVFRAHRQVGWLIGIRV